MFTGKMHRARCLLSAKSIGSHTVCLCPPHLSLCTRRRRVVGKYIWLWGSTPSSAAQRKAAWSDLSFSTVPSASVDVSPHGPNCCSQSVCLGRGGGLGTACAPHNLAMWLSFTPGNALSLLVLGRVWCPGLFPVLRKEWTVSPEDYW